MILVEIFHSDDHLSLECSLSRFHTDSMELYEQRLGSNCEVSRNLLGFHFNIFFSNLFLRTLLSNKLLQAFLQYQQSHLATPKLKGKCANSKVSA